MIRVPIAYGPADRCVPVTALAARERGVRIADLPEHLRPLRAPVLPPRPPTAMEIALSRTLPPDFRQAPCGCQTCLRSIS